MGDGHVFAQTSHQCHLVAVNGMDDATGAKEEAGLEHGVGEEVEHAGHIAQTAVVEVFAVAGEAYAESHHHEGNLRDSGEGKHALDVALCAGDGSGIEGGEGTYPNNDGETLGSVLNPDGEHTCNLEHTGHNHRGGVDEGRNRRRTFHGIGKPDVEGEHRTLSGTADEHQDKRDGKHRHCGVLHQCSLRIAGDEVGHVVSIFHRSGKAEVEALGVVSEDEDTDEEEHVGKAGDDEGLLAGGNGGSRRVVEADEKVGADTYELPEKIHLEDVRGHYQSEHRHGEEAEVGIVALEAAFTVHISE